MSTFVTPIAILNMGSEMLYILHQRLGSQPIPTEKKNRVIQDIIQSMLNDAFLTEVFRPSQLSNHETIRKLFERMAHASIMRLSPTSMDKLYDLMRMGFKHQIFSCPSADHLLRLTIIHLENVKKFCDRDEIVSCVSDAIERVKERYSEMTAGEFFLIKETLCRFFQDVSIKVSLFIKQNIQHSDGTLVIWSDGLTASGGEIPGTVRYYASDGSIRRESHFQMKNAEKSVCHMGGMTSDRFADDSDGLGRDLYGDLYTTDGVYEESKESIESDKEIKDVRQFQTSAEDGVNLLAALMGEREEKTESFRVHLFGLGGMSEIYEEEETLEEGKAVPIVRINARREGNGRESVGDLLMKESDGKSDGESEEIHEERIGLSDFQ